MLRISALIIISCLLLSSVAFAQNRESEFSMNLKWSKHFYDQMIQDMDDLQPNDNPQPADYQEYLYHAFLAVYFAKVYVHFTDMDGSEIAQTNSDLTRLVDLGYLDGWPLNPLANWEPMQVTVPENGFSAGNLCFVLCPPSLYTSRLGGPQLMSFDLFIYGPNIEFSQFAEIAQVDENKEWSTPPEGALYGFSYYIEPDMNFQDD